ncbi:PAS domain-containing protein [Hymenobacter monticola]|uniref:histidine kinase n=1 Tax=Hymenobacter monticola TaxID=1705399 RepID=A0ABY4BCQ8_9BACT|nr:PAS domain-containing protein [Hymenobacter monticola]UOE36569.1 PAS domain-containing protein [Hymenobacter monticola]
MPATSVPLPLRPLPADDLLGDLLAVSMTGVIYYTPIYDPAGTGEIVDFTFVYLNPTAQRMMSMPEVPTVTHNQQWPHSIAHGTFAFHVDAYVSGEPREYNINYQADGYDNYYRLAARRSGDGLWVSFTDTADQPRSPVEVALREAQAREQAARAEAEAERMRLHQVLMRMPANIALLRGPEHVYELVNPEYERLFPGRPLLGRTIREVIPDIEGQGFYELFDRVYETGEPFYEAEAEAWADYSGSGEPQRRYYHTTFEPIRNAQGAVTEVLNFAVDVTAQVAARQQVEQLNQELESRVQVRTREALALQADLLAAARQQVQEREAFHQIFEQTPAVVALLRAPGHRYEYVNPSYQALFPDRQLVGRNVAEAVPELDTQGFVALLDQVYQTGDTYVGQEMPFTPQPAAGAAPRTGYYNFTYQAYREGGEVAGISILGYDVTEQVLARREREAERRQLHELFMQAPAPIVILDGPELVFQLVNPAYQRIFPGRVLLGKPLLVALPELADTSIPGLFRQVYETGEMYVARELPLQLAREENGPLEEIIWTFTYQARRNAAGAVDGVLVFAYEVTEQVQARRVVEASEQQVRALVESAPFPIGVYVGPELRIQLANEAILAAWGKGSDVIGRRFADVLPELEGQAVVGQLHQVRTTGEPLHLRNERVDLLIDGRLQPFYFNYSFTPLRDGQGRVYGVLNTAADVTDLALARQRLESYAGELQESEARFRTMADAAPNMVWAVHPDSTIRYINRAFLNFVGLGTEAEYLVTGWEPYIHPSEFELVQQTLTQAIAQRQPYVLEHRMRRHDGEYRWLLAQGSPSYLAGGELYGYVGSAIDITELKQANEQLTRTNVDLDNFIYTASHDLKQPIANIEGLLQAVEHELPPAGRVGEVSNMLHLMQQAIERFGRTIAHLTDISRLQHEHNEPASQVHLARVVQEVALDLAPLIAPSQARVRVNVPPELTLRFSEKNLRSIVYNLLSNALKYRHPDRAPDVVVAHTQRASEDVLEVRDNGLGLDLAQDQEKVFGMFKRLHPHVEGSGVGLYMVKKIVENAGGRIEVDSVLGQGSTFRVYFPR